mmetsp:Transcript_22091/g.50510  ORF Transcript_22091/g.50510 Transcript_22091/m.50510 type:complete len:206 (-) Transcript_22091:172-789(-)
MGCSGSTFSGDAGLFHGACLHPAASQAATSAGSETVSTTSSAEASSTVPVPPRQANPRRVHGIAMVHNSSLVARQGDQDMALVMAQFRDLKPEDFELLCALDESIPKRNVMPRNKLQNLGTAIARECGATECGICLMALDPEATVTRLPCRHTFHQSCVSRWLTECKSSCPLCNVSIPITPVTMDTSEVANPTTTAGNSEVAYCI